MVQDLQRRGIPIDGVGHEMHNAINYPSVAAMVNAIDTVADNFPDLDQQVTETGHERLQRRRHHLQLRANNIPPSVLAEQGWLYKQYFDAVPPVATASSARVTFWGMADDDTWLDSFPVTRTDYPLPFDMGLQAKPAYWGIVDETHLPGYGLKLTSAITGNNGNRTITLTATNGNVGTAYNTLINGVTLKLDDSKHASCTATVTAPSAFPLSLGDIPVGGAASVSVNVTLNGCNPGSEWVVQVPWSSATYETGTYTFQVEFENGNH